MAPLTTAGLWKRLERYCETTGLKSNSVPRHHGWSRLGLPDLRGFTPHLRTVNLYQEQSFSPESWIIHDILHILFYDFVAINLGEESWLERERFFENHLASEAFAVLALDYHVLADSGETLTVDVSTADWNSFRKLNPKLPEANSPEFCEMLVRHYLTGDAGAMRVARPSAAYEKWIGHEIRYAAKQRSYVSMWHDDLTNRRFSNTAVQVEGSAVHEAVWELIELLLYSNESDWNAYAEEAAGGFSKNSFSRFSKYVSPPNSFDFRFTDVSALENIKISEIAKSFKTPSAGGLFLFWQIVAQEDPLNISKDQLKLIESVAAASQNNSISQSQWERLRELTSLRLAKREPGIAAPDYLAAFFLP